MTIDDVQSERVLNAKGRMSTLAQEPVRHAEGHCGDSYSVKVLPATCRHG